MKTSGPIERLVAASLFALVLVLAVAQRAQSETWKIASPEWPPYAGADLPDNGRAIDRLRTVLQRAGITPGGRFHALVAGKGRRSLQ